MSARLSAEELRREFDRGFAAAPAPPARLVPVLVLRVGGHRCAVRVVEAAGVHTCPAIAVLPSAVDELLGLVVLRGTLVAIYDLGALLGLERTAAPRWLLLAGRPAVALGFDALESHTQIPGEAFLASTAASHRGLAVGAVRLDGVVLPVLSLNSVHDAIARRVTPIDPKEPT